MIAQVKAGGPSVPEYACALDGDGMVTYTKVYPCAVIGCPTGYILTSADEERNCCCMEFVP